MLDAKAIAIGTPVRATVEGVVKHGVVTDAYELREESYICSFCMLDKNETVCKLFECTSWKRDDDTSVYIKENEEHGKA